MSDTSEDTASLDRQNDKESSICRDFVRGLCERPSCKYKHEYEVKPLNFCHDYQNTICPRSNCKFIHCTAEEVEEYKQTSQMSSQMFAEAIRKNQLAGSIPICNQFKQGMCRRNFCKYRHITAKQEEAEIIQLIMNNTKRNDPVPLNNNINESQFVTLGTLNNAIRRDGVNFEEYNNDGLPSVKRRFFQTQDQGILACDVIDQNQTSPVFQGYFAGTPPLLNGVDARTMMLEEENSFLHKEVAQLKRRVSDLLATNEFLLDQNANLRLSGKRTGVTVPVTVSTLSNTQAPATQRVIAVSSVATVPVSLATVSTCNPMSGNHTVSIAAGCPVSIASPAAHVLGAANQQILVTTNPTTQLAIVNSSQAQLAIAQQNLANNLAQQAQPQLTSQAQQLALATTTQQLTSQAQHMTNLALASGPQQLASQAQQLANQQLNSQAQQLANQQLNSQAQQLANQQLTSQAQHIANQQLTSQAQQLANQQLTSQAQQLANQQLTSQAQQLANQQLTSQAQQLANQQLTSQAQQLANQQLNSQAQQLALATTTQQLTSQAQQLAMATTNQQLTLAGANQQLTLAGANQQLTSQAQQLAMANTPQQLTVANVPQQLALASANQQLLAQQNLGQSQQMEMHRNNQINAINTSRAIAMSNASQPMVSFAMMTQQSLNHALSH